MILYADDALIIADKPADLLSVPGRGPDKQDCLVARIRETHADALTVHRLDQATSGLNVLARGAEAHRALSQAFAAREVAKRYVAVVAGEVTDDSGEIDLPLITDWPNRPRQMVDHQRGKPSLTRWRVLERGQGRTRLALEPVTGRSHQLRVHLMAVGHPILGDAFYAPPDILAQSPRLLLHAEHLAFAHPVTGVALEFASPAPF